MINRRELFYILLPFAIGVPLLIFFPLIDLEFSESVYAYRVWADWMLRAAAIPGIIAAFLLSVRLTTFAVLRNARQKEDTATPLQMIVGLLSVFFLPIFALWCFMTFFNQTVDLVGWIMLFVIIIFSVTACYFKNRDIDSKTRRIMSSRALTGVLLYYVLVLTALVISALWNRVSYQTLVSVGSTEYYTPWFRLSNSGLLSEVTGGRRFNFGSFPSVSVALAGTVAVFVYFGNGANRRVRDTLYAVGFLYELLIGVLAVMNGQCYVTDVVFAILLNLLLTVLANLILQWVHPEDYGNMYEIISGME